ncbi:hypothetical protein NP493_805g02036 [Ridgeia piscesae]|uniref:Uncharacterized protein n=1 Tax=Ridgeia piscesae TaxID=27915 RepID=A0AAD9KNE1_RIDPI|nr:hypothetical protein NP493_805g02036 [Ridgeia piscesae]
MYSYTALYTKIASCTQTLNAPWISQTSDSWNIYIYIYTYRTQEYHRVHQIQYIPAGLGPNTYL